MVSLSTLWLLLVYFICQITDGYSLQCNQSVHLDYILLQPDNSGGLFSGVHSCSAVNVDVITIFNCKLPNLLTDGNTGPIHPDLSDSLVITQFLGWRNRNNNRYLTFHLESPSLVNFINLYLYINPSKKIGVPNFEIYNISGFQVTPTGDDLQLEFDIINNSQLSQEDNRVREITLRLRTPVLTQVLLLTWNYDNVRDIEQLFMSEITLCSDDLPSNFTLATISFLNPTRHTTIITPQSELFQNTSLTLTCTVSNEGSFMWRWRRGNRLIDSSDPETSIETADATRTSILTVPASSDIYHCDVSLTINKDYHTRNFNASAPSFLNAMRMEPDEFLGSTSATFSRGCRIVRKTALCNVPSILADGNVGPLKPDFSQEEDVRSFVAWNSMNPRPYITLRVKPSPLTVKGIELAILNNPSNGISAPYFIIYGMTTEYLGDRLEYDIINNHLLTLQDNTVRQIILKINNPAPYLYYELKWSFTNLYNISWFLLSEVKVHLYLQQSSSGNFRLPATVIMNSTSGHILPDGSIRLNCTIAHDGRYTWRWLLSYKTNVKYKRYAADMSRTSILIVQPFHHVNRGNTSYHCEAHLFSLPLTRARTSFLFQTGTVFAQWSPLGSLIAYESNTYNICISLTVSQISRWIVMAVSVSDNTAHRMQDYTLGINNKYIGVLTGSSTCIPLHVIENHRINFRDRSFTLKLSTTPWNREIIVYGELLNVILRERRNTFSAQFEESEITVKTSEGNFTVCLQVLQGSVDSKNSATFPLQIAGGDLTYFTLSKSFFSLTGNQGTSCITGFIHPNEHVTPTQNYYMTIVNSSIPIMLINNVSLTILDDINEVLIMDTEVIHNVKAISNIFHFCVLLRSASIDDNTTVAVYVDFLNFYNAIPNVDYKLVTFEINLNSINKVRCENVQIYRDGVVRGYPKYFALQISRVESSLNIRINRQILSVSIEDNDELTVYFTASQYEVIYGSALNVCVKAEGTIERGVDIPIDLKYYAEGMTSLGTIPLVRYKFTSLVNLKCQIINTVDFGSSGSFNMSLHSSIPILLQAHVAEVIVTTYSLHCSPLNVLKGYVFYEENQATITCYEGYTLMGDSGIRCNPYSRQWKAKRPSCVEPFCELLRSPQNGRIIFSNNLHLQSVASYLCNKGYRIRGNFQRLCLSNRTWSESSPTCSQDGTSVLSYDATVVIISSFYLLTLLW